MEGGGSDRRAGGEDIDYDSELNDYSSSTSAGGHCRFVEHRLVYRKSGMSFLPALSTS